MLGGSQVEDDLEDLIHNKTCYGVTPNAVNHSAVMYFTGWKRLYGYNRERGKTLTGKKLAVYLKSCGFAEYYERDRTDEGTNSFQHKLTFGVRYTDKLVGNR
jgi:hypothetical protein